MEVFPPSDASWDSLLGYLHVCGGVSKTDGYVHAVRTQSSHLWRCFVLDLKSSTKVIEFFTLVEVFPTKAQTLVSSVNRLHICGGVSYEG